MKKGVHLKLFYLFLVFSIFLFLSFSFVLAVDSGNCNSGSLFGGINCYNFLNFTDCNSAPGSWCEWKNGNCQSNSGFICSQYDNKKVDCVGSGCAWVDAGFCDFKPDADAICVQLPMSWNNLALCTDAGCELSLGEYGGPDLYCLKPSYGYGCNNVGDQAACDSKAACVWQGTCSNDDTTCQKLKDTKTCDAKPACNWGGDCCHPASCGDGYLDAGESCDGESNCNGCKCDAGFYSTGTGECSSYLCFFSPATLEAVDYSFYSYQDDAVDVLCSSNAQFDTNDTYLVSYNLLINGEIAESFGPEALVPILNNNTPISHKFTHVQGKGKVVQCSINITAAVDGEGCAAQNLFSNNLDFDRDGFTAASDCDDWPYDDYLIVAGKDYLCPYTNSFLDLIADDPSICFNDNNNNGLGDYAACAPCRNPNMMEQADNVDNNCLGTCQGNTSVSCGLSDVSYFGDGNLGGGCEDVKNSFGQSDSFCQMVDDLSGCNGYNRAVKYFERTVNMSDLVIPKGLYLGDAVYKYNRTYSFVPGGNKDSVCSRMNKYTPVSGTVVAKPFEYLFKFFPNLNPAMVFYEYSSMTANGKIPTLLNEDTYPGCLPALESEAKKRGTIGLNNQYIDSFRGELDFYVFWNSAFPIIQEKNSDGDFISTWQTTCVAKDKCKDGFDNDGIQNLYSTKPYSFYSPHLVETLDENGKTSFIPTSDAFFPVRLKDTDDPECKFKVDQLFIKNTDTYHPEIIFDSNNYNYLTNPQTGLTYCKDEDGDGFCGCNTMTLCSLGNKWNTPWTTKELALSNYIQHYPQYSSFPLQGVVSDGSGNYCVNVCNMSDTTYDINTQFPDCDDSPGMVDYTYNNGNPLYLSQQYGWIGYYDDKKLYDSWAVHPLAPATGVSCTLGRYDFNCNKDATQNLDLSALRKGQTPFDFDVSTGVEISTHEGVSNNLKKDSVCYYTPPWREFTTIMGGTAAFSVLGVGPALLVKLSSQAAWALTTAKVATQAGFALGLFGDLYSVSRLQELDKALASGAVTWDEAKWDYGITMASMIPSTLLVAKGVGWDVKLGTLKGSTKVNGAEAGAVVMQPKKPVAETLAQESAQPTPKMGGCFLADTKVLMADGSYKSIQDILIGDNVMAYDLENEKAVSAPVTYTFVRNETKYRIIEYEEVA